MNEETPMEPIISEEKPTEQEEKESVEEVSVPIKQNRPPRVISWLTLAIFAAGMFVFAFIPTQIRNESRSPVNQVTSTWTESQLRKNPTKEATLLDKNILEVHPTLKEWAEEYKEEEGVHAKTEGEYTYLLVSGGKAEKKKLIQLFDVVETKNEIIVGYSFLEPKEIGVEPKTAIPYTLLRINPTEKVITGRIIKE